MLYPDKDSLWYKGKYKFTIDIPNDYPHKAPHCMCITPVNPIIIRNLFKDLSS